MIVTRRYRCIPPSHRGLGDWVQFEITDPAFCAVPKDYGDITAQTVDGREVMVYVLSMSPSAIRLSLSLPATGVEGQPIDVILTATDEGKSRGWTGWGREYPTPATNQSVGPDLLIRDGKGESIQSNQWVHPNVYRVDHLPAEHPLSWLKYKDATERDAEVGTVTHIRVDTAYPNGSDQWENPYLLYSTDDGQTWHEWHGSINPVEPWPGGEFNADPYLSFKSDGTVEVWHIQSPAFDSLVHPVTGTCLADAVAGSSRVVSGGGFAIVEHEGVWYRYHREYQVGLLYVTSTDEGQTWSDPTPMLLAASTGAGDEYSLGWWHGAVVGRVEGGPMPDGYYYMTWSEAPDGNANSGAADVRLWRARHPIGPWEPARPILSRWGTGVAVHAWYQPCLMELSGGGYALFSSGVSSGGNAYLAARIPVDLSVSALNENEALQWGLWRGGNPVPDSHRIVGDRGTVVEVNPEPLDPTGPIAFVLEPYTPPAGDAVDFVLGGGEPDDRSGAVRVEGGGSVTASGDKAAAGATTITAGGTLAATGAKHTSGAAHVSGGGTVTATGTASEVVSGSVHVSGGGSVQPTGAKHTSGQATVSGGGSADTSATKHATGQASVTGGGRVTARGSSEEQDHHSGAVHVSGGGGLSVSGEKRAAGTASISAGGQVSSEGKKAGAGRVHVSGGGLIITSARKLAHGTVYIIGGGRVRAEGHNPEHVPVPPFRATLTVTTLRPLMTITTIRPRLTVEDA